MATIKKKTSKIGKKPTKKYNLSTKPLSSYYESDLPLIRKYVKKNEARIKANIKTGESYKKPRISVPYEVKLNMIINTINRLERKLKSKRIDNDAKTVIKLMINKEHDLLDKIKKQLK